MTDQVRGPRQRTELDDGHKGEVSSGEATLRGAKLLLALLNPVIAVVTLLWLVPVVRQSVVKKMWVVLFAGAATFCALLLGALPAYLGVYVSLWEMASGVFGEHGILGVRELGPALVVWAQNHGLASLVGQLGLAVPVGLLCAAIVAARRARYRAEWRQEKKRASARSVAAATKRLKQWPQKPEEVRQLADLKVLLGVDRETAEPYSLPALAFTKHAFIDGPSGFGKTTDLVTLMRGLVEAPAAQRLGIGMIYVNMKPDPDITESIRGMAAAAGRQLHIITENGIGATTTYNPLRHGTSEQARNILVEAEALAADGGFSEAHYRRGGERYTLLCMKVLSDLVGQGKKYTNEYRKIVPWRRDLPHLARVMQLKVLLENADLVNPALQTQVAEYAREMDEDRDLVKSGSGMRQRFASAIEGAAGAVLVEEPDGLDLRAAIQDGDVVLFNLDAARDAQAARQIGNLAIQDVQAALSELGAEKWQEGEPLPRLDRTGQPGRRPLLTRREAPGPVQMRMELLIVDEFSALGGTLLQNLFERSRSNGGAVILATQVAGVMEELSPAFKESVIKNSNVKILHQQDDDAEDYANLIGTEKAIAETFQTFDDKDLLGKQTRHSGQGSLRKVDQFIVHPNELKQLNPGEAIVFTKTPRQQNRVMIRRMSTKYLPSAVAGTETAESGEQLESVEAAATSPSAADVDPWEAAVVSAVQESVRRDEEGTVLPPEGDWMTDELPPEMTPPEED